MTIPLEVVFHPDAERDLTELYLYIVAEGQPIAAKTYVDRLIDYCERLSLFPQRGRGRPDLGRNVRVVGFERRASIVFAVRGTSVVIGGIAYAGRRPRRFPKG